MVRFVQRTFKLVSRPIYLLRGQILFLFIFSLLMISEITYGQLLFTVDPEPERNAQIQRPSECGSRIGAGGNLLDSGTRWAGKCQNGGMSPRIEREGVNHFLRFISFTPARGAGSRDRTELALTSYNFNFHKNYYFSFDLRIPEGVDRVDEMFYPLQFWQCAPRSPIAGIRVSRGHSHRINFMTRGDNHDRRGFNWGSVDLKPRQWHRIRMMLNVAPRRGQGKFKAWVDGQLIADVSTSFGHFTSDACNNPGRPPQHYRLKFGIYKSGEPGKRFIVDIDDLKIGETSRSVRSSSKLQ